MISVSAWFIWHPKVWMKKDSDILVVKIDSEVERARSPQSGSGKIPISSEIAPFPRTAAGAPQ
jgi:hypothetical protein